MSEQAEARYWIGCVDDDRNFLESARRLIGRTLEENPTPAPCEVEMTPDANEFVELVSEMDKEGAELALLITDQIMPECSGLELIERVKPGHPATACVLLTGYAGLESARYAINKHLLDRYVCKPIEDMKQFSDLVLSELERFHLRRMERIQAAEIERQSAALRVANERLGRMKSVAECVAYFSRELRTLDLDEVLNLVCDKAPALFGAKSSFLFVPDWNNKMTLWRERRVKCLAPVPPTLDVNKVLRQAIITRKPALALRREWCSGSLEGSCESLGCVVMPIQLSRRDPAFTDGSSALPALLCLCGIEGEENLLEEVLEYKMLLINDILGANIANAMAFCETERLAKQDSLTGARTRRVFDDLLRAEWERYQRYKAPFCVAILDVDHLKQINDTFGHAAGDEVLRRVAEVVSRISRRCDVLARYGGDEFCVLLPETDIEGARTLMERIAKEIRNTRVSLINGPASVSVGIACVSGKRSPEELLAGADRALYESKRAGRGRLSVGMADAEGAAKSGVKKGDANGAQDPCSG